MIVPLQVFHPFMRQEESAIWNVFFFRLSYLMFIYFHDVCGGKAEIPLKKPRYNKSFSVMVKRNEISSSAPTSEKKKKWDEIF